MINGLHYIGNVFLFNNKSKKSWYSRAQRFFTGYPYSHTSIGLSIHFGEAYVLSSDKLCYVQSLESYLSSDTIDMEAYKFKLSDERMTHIINKFVKKWSGVKYAYYQILWFVFRWFCEKILKKDVRKHHNWFAKNEIVCSELTYFYLRELAKVYKLQDLSIKLDEWHSSNVHVGDIKNILESFPQYFVRIA